MSGYGEQRKKGALDIAALARTTAEEANITIVKCAWDNGQEMNEKSKHVLVLTSNENCVEAEFSDEQLADYPGRVGTEHTDSIILKMIRHLSDLECH